MINKFSFFVFLSLLSAPTFAKLQLISDLSLNEGRKEDYQIGDEWGKKKVTSSVLKKESDVFVRAASATAYLPIGGTGFYLGKFGDTHVLATNHHVCPVESDCVGQNAGFRMINKKYRMTKLFVTLPDVDLSLLEIKVPAEDEALMKEIGRNFAFNKDIQKGQRLLTVGFGIAANPGNNMMANQDSDCKVFSESSEYRHLADPDEFNPADYKAWSFAHACEISHGDSGSAMIDRDTGDVVGIVWTGRIPKSPLVQNSDNLNDIFESSSPEIWEELSYAVPAVKIGEYLKQISEDGRYRQETRDLFKAMLRH